MKIADETARLIHIDKQIQKTFTDEEIDQIAKLYYKCYDENPVGFQKYVEEEHAKWEKRFIANGKKKEEVRLRPWIEIYALMKKIANKYGVPFAEVISTPAFLRCKFLPDKIDSVESNLPSTKMYFDFVVEDILKGDKFFSIGKTINIRYYYPTLFEEGGTYFIPITTLYTPANYKGEIFVKYLQENYYTVTDGGVPAKIFPIEDGIIKNCEYFGIKDTSWTDFKKYFKDTYLIFE
jgi:hypothetical protein